MQDSSLLQRLIVAGIATPETIVPCTPEEVRHVEASLNIALPADYKDFLLTAGKCAGYFMADVSIYYPEILSNRSAALQKLDDWEGDGLHLPTGSHVFAYRPAEQFWFFLCNGSLSTGCIYHYYEGRGVFESVSESFPGFIHAHLQSIETRLLERAINSEWLQRFHQNALQRASRVRALGDQLE